MIKDKIKCCVCNRPFKVDKLKKITEYSYVCWVCDE